ncbi:MAG TPA: hypothetical protein VIV11_36290 [Kofleriaceae bacterium]
MQTIDVTKLSSVTGGFGSNFSSLPSYPIVKPDPCPKFSRFEAGARERCLATIK